MAYYKEGVFEITDIIRKTGLLEADSIRLGRRYVPKLIAVGKPAVLVHADDDKKALYTSPVKHEYGLNDRSIGFITENTEYKLREVGD